MAFDLQRVLERAEDAGQVWDLEIHRRIRRIGDTNSYWAVILYAEKEEDNKLLGILDLEIEGDDLDKVLEETLRAIDDWIEEHS